MKFNSNYLEMVKASELIRQMRENVNLGEYYFDTKSGKVEICIVESLKLEKDEFWIPRVDQLLELLPEEDSHQGGARRSVESLTNCYHIPNSGKTYETYNEYFLSLFIYRKEHKIWVEGIDGNSKPNNIWNWRSENELLNEKVGIENKTKSDTRLVSIKDDSGKDIGRRTERIKYNFDKKEIEVVEVLDEYYYTK